MSCPLYPMPEKLVVKREEAESVTKGGIVLPDSAKEKPEFARVLAVGETPLLDGKKDIRYQITVGSRICLTRWAGSNVTLDGVEYGVIDYRDVLAVVK